MPPPYTRLASETLSSKQPQGPELDSKGQSQGHPNTAHRAPQGPSASYFYQPPHTHPSTKSAKGEGKKKTVIVIKPVLTNRGGGEGEEGRRLRLNGSAPAACTRLSGRARARRRVDLAARRKLQCKDYAAAAAWRPQLPGPPGPPLWTPASLSSRKVGRGGRFPRASGGRWGSGLPH